jgi:hypothetical protein
MPSNGIRGSCHLRGLDAQVQTLESMGSACVSPRMAVVGIVRNVRRSADLPDPQAPAEPALKCRA